MQRPPSFCRGERGNFKGRDDLTQGKRRLFSREELTLLKRRDTCPQGKRWLFSREENRLPRSRESLGRSGRGWGLERGLSNRKDTL